MKFDEIVNKYNQIKQLNSNLIRWEDNFSLNWVRDNFSDRLEFTSCEFHEEICNLCNQIYQNQFSKLCVLAPRGCAKSTYISYAFVIFAVRKYKYILILSDSFFQAKKLLNDIREKIDYLIKRGNSTSLLLNNGTLIEASGSGCKIRGRRHGKYRPELIIIDDPQSNSDIISAKERNNSWDWFTREVIPCGSVNTKYILVATNLHPDCIANKVKDLFDWKVVSYPALVRYPDNIHLWDSWHREVLSGCDLEEIEKKYFNQEHIQLMEQGGKSIWENKWKVSDLMKIKYSIGNIAFNTEYQQDSNNSIVGSEFPYDLIHSSFVDNCNVNISKFIQVCDPSLAKNEKSDYQAHCFGGFGTDGIIYVWSYAAKDKDWLETIINIHSTINSEKICIEENATMGLAIPFLKNKLSNKIEEIELVGIYHTQPKSQRIKGLYNLFSSGKLKLVKSNYNTIPNSWDKLKNELVNWPNVKNDDLIDALAFFVEVI